MQDDPHFIASNSADKSLHVHEWGKGYAIHHKTALYFVITWLEANVAAMKVVAAGHRIVPGGIRFEARVLIEGDVMDCLDSLAAMEPFHRTFNVRGARAFAEALRHFVIAGGYRSPSLLLVVEAIAVASILAGNLLALLQNNVKRILAYSSIAHLVYKLVAFLAAGSLAVEAVSYYLVAYFVTMLGAFGVVAMLLSLACIPMTMGFIAKFYVVTAGVGASLWLLVIVLVIGSAIGLFYYLRVIAAMATSVPAGFAGPPSIAANRMPAAVTGGALAVLTLLLLWLGIVPAPLMRLLQATVGHLTVTSPAAWANALHA